MNKKLRGTLEVLDNCLGTKQYIDENKKEVFEREKLTVEELFYCGVFCLDYGCLCVIFLCF